MIPKISCIGFCFYILMLSGCNTDTAIKDGKNDPVLVEYPVIYIERDLETVSGENPSVASFADRDPARFNPGAQLHLKKNAFTDSPDTIISADLFGENQRYDIRDLTISDDGQQLLLSIRAPEIEGADENEQPHWNIWRYQLADQILERIIVSDTTAEQGDDIMPAFLPDGRIIFASTRQRLSRAILLDEGKPQYTAVDERRSTSVFNLHVMNADGTNIKQLTFNMSHDLYPLVMQNGKILYSRWDAMGGRNMINLYQMNPDGTDNHIMFGWHSHQLEFEGQQYTVDFSKPQQLPNGDILLLLRSTNDSLYQKLPVIINVNEFTDNEQSIDNSTSAAPAVTPFSLSDSYHFSLSDQLTLSGRLNSLFPLPDTSNRYLLSWDLCRAIIDQTTKACGQLTEQQLADPQLVLAPPLFELWLFNQNDNTQQLVASTEQGKMITEAVVLQPASQTKTFIADQTAGVELNAELMAEQAAAIHIRSVYDFDGEDITKTNDNPNGINTLMDPSLVPADDLPARFLRIIRGVPMPPRDVRNVMNTDFGRSNNQLMREIIGYTAIQPDGSVKVKVPANVPFALSILDKNGHRITSRHRQWITLRPGETLECNGCHTPNSTLPHGRQNAEATSINSGANTNGSAFLHASENIIPMQGQTMAEADEMVNGLAELTADINYQDIWTNPTFSSVNPSIQLQYENLTTLAPNGLACFQHWTAFCRIQINYIEHIQPIWQAPRLTVDPTTQVTVNNTCTACHSRTDSNGLTQIPAGQLELTNEPSVDQANHVTSYRELFFNDVEQELIDGILVDKRIPLLDENGNIIYEVDSNGELILDANGNPIPVLTTINIDPILSPAGANSSQPFFDLFSNDPIHQQFLTESELKLISEWLDIGAQYYNTPFYQQD